MADKILIFNPKSCYCSFANHCGTIQIDAIARDVYYKCGFKVRIKDANDWIDATYCTPLVNLSKRATEENNRNIIKKFLGVII